MITYTRNDSTGEIIEYEGRTPTPAEAAAAEAHWQAQQSATALHASAAQSLAGYTYQGVNFDLAQQLTYYEAVARKAADGLLDGLYPVQLVGTDGLVEAADASAIAAAYADMEAHAMAVQIQLGNQLKALQS